MADVTLTGEAMVEGGLAATYNSSLNTADTHFVNNDGRTFLHFKKTGAGAANVTIVTPRTLGGRAVADLVVVIPATTGDKFLGPFPPAIFNAPGTHNLTWTVDEVTGLSVAVVRLAPA